MGVEEEFLLIGADGGPVAVAGVALDADRSALSAAGTVANLDHELKEEQLETGTEPQADLAELAAGIAAGRRRAAEAAGRAGARIAAVASSPVAVRSTFSTVPRSRRIGQTFALTAREQLTCGCHVHVAVADDDEGVAVLDRIGRWLAPLLALTANSPFWNGEDSGYASFRSQVWSRWPTAGPTAPFGSARVYHRVVGELVDSGTILDAGMVYFDARLSAHLPTVEVRIADVCLRAEDATLLAALVRGLVETAAREAADGVGVPMPRAELLRAAGWRAGRSGLTGELLSPASMRPLPAREVIGELVAHVRPALQDAGDLEPVLDGLRRVWERGTGADTQRGWAAEGGPAAVVDGAARLTLA